MSSRPITRPSKQRRPTVYVIAGPNGAGMTTFATTFLPDFVDCKEFLNADLIAAGLSPFAPETQNIRAGRLLLTRMRELSEAGVDFGFETTLAGRGYARQFEDWRTHGYSIVLHFLWLPSVELAIARVESRVKEGGHTIAEADIRRRYSSGMRNFWGLYRPLLDAWRLYDGSEYSPALIASADQDVLAVQHPASFAHFTSLVET